MSVAVAMVASPVVVAIPNVSADVTTQGPVVMVEILPTPELLTTYTHISQGIMEWNLKNENMLLFIELQHSYIKPILAPNFKYIL